MSLTLLERLRKKPKAVRVQVSFLTALCVTGMIAVVWGATLSMHTGPASENFAAVASQESGLAAFFSDSKANLAQLIGVTTVEVKTVPQETPGTSASGAYRAGAPADASAPSGYDRLLNPEPAVTPIDRREVRIGTSTDAR